MDTTERIHFHFSFDFSLSCIGEGNGSPLQCSCLENPRDRGAWWAAVCGVAQSRTRLKRLSSSSSSGGDKVGKSPGDDSTGLCVPRGGGRVWQGSGCCGQAGAWQRLWGRTWASAVPPGGAGAGAGPAAPQGSLLILPTARSSAAQASLAQRRGTGAAGLAGRKPPPSLCPLSRDHWGSFRLARQR